MLLYRPPPSHKTVTIVWPGPIFFASLTAPTTFSAADGPKAAGRQNYLGRVHYIDAAFGRLVAQLKDRGMYNNTVIVMSAE